MKKLIIFGAGKNGEIAIQKFGKENIEHVIDNNQEKVGKLICGLKIESPELILRNFVPEKNIIMITPENNGEIISQLKGLGISEYLTFHNDRNLIESRVGNERKFYKENKILDSLVKECETEDLLKDTKKFKELCVEALRKNKEEGLVLLHRGYREEGDYYGNCKTLLRYAECKNYEEKYAPNVSHNATLPVLNSEIIFKSSVIVSGKYFVENIHRRYPYVPVFTVGPYIKYEQGIYSIEKVNEIKKKNGKTAVVFLPHSIETIKRDYTKKNFIDRVLEEYGTVFDKFYLSVYWADMPEDVCAYAENKGMQLVSAGFRFDYNFNRRLKTILDLSDVVIGGDRGTHFMYALACGKKIARVEIDDNTTIHDKEFKTDLQKKLQLGIEYEKYNKKFYELITSEPHNTKRQRDWLNPYCGFDIYKSKEEMRNIFLISKDLLLQCEGEMRYYPEAIRKVYMKYEEDNAIEKMFLLNQAMGTYLD